MENMLGISLQEILGPIQDFLEKLGGRKGRQWLIAFKRFLRKENPWADGIMFETDILSFKPEKEIHGEEVRQWLRVFQSDPSVAEYFKLLDPSKSFMNKALSMIGRIDIVLLSVKDLGFENEASLEEIYKKAKEHGFKLCSKEICLYFCRDRQKYDWPDGVIIASEPIGPEKVLFEVADERDLVGKKTEVGLRVQNGSMFGIWGKGTLFAFEVH